MCKDQKVTRPKPRSRLSLSNINYLKYVLCFWRTKKLQCITQAVFFYYGEFDQTYKIVSYFLNIQELPADRKIFLTDEVAKLIHFQPNQLFPASCCSFCKCMRIEKLRMCAIPEILVSVSIQRYHKQRTKTGKGDQAALHFKV